MAVCPFQVCSKLSPELSDLVVYCKSAPFRGFENLSEKPPDEMSSFSESDALRLIKDSGTSVEIKSKKTQSILITAADSAVDIISPGCIVACG